MKTIDISSRGNLIRVAAVIGGLATIYLYRRGGGSLTKLVSGVVTGNGDLMQRAKSAATSFTSDVTTTAQNMLSGGTAALNNNTAQAPAIH